MSLFNIKNVPVQSRVMLAPMAGVTDVVFRALVRHWAPNSLICTEMISSNALIMSRQRKARILDHTASDHPIAYQLSGNRPEILIQAAQQVIEDHAPETLDLNMGCPVKKITGNFEGCSLMREPELAASLIKSLVQEVDTPITVKFRLGWDFNSMNYLDFGKRCEDAGASMVTLHARTRSQGYQPGCKWEAFGLLKEALSIPVIANGDIRSPEDARFILETYGVDGVMIGRACQGEPWMIGELDQYLKTGQPLRKWSIQERLQVALEHSERLCDYRGKAVGIREIRKHLAWYAQDFPGVRAYRNRLTQVNSLEEIHTLFDEILSQQLAISA
jgi:tRNA-dihydrouridine synthase B